MNNHESGEGSKIIFNGEEIPIRAKKTIKKIIKQPFEKITYDTSESDEHTEEKNIQDKTLIDKNSNGKQLFNSKNSIIGEGQVTQDELKRAIVWSEILGKPVCKTRGARRQGRR